jgi:hypothetical protein
MGRQLLPLDPVDSLEDWERAKKTAQGHVREGEERTTAQSEILKGQTEFVCEHTESETHQVVGRLEHRDNGSR